MDGWMDRYFGSTEDPALGLSYDGPEDISTSRPMTIGLHGNTTAREKRYPSFPVLWLSKHTKLIPMAAPCLRL